MTINPRTLTRIGQAAGIACMFVGVYGWTVNSKPILGAGLAVDLIGLAFLAASNRMIRVARKRATR